MSAAPPLVRPGDPSTSHAAARPNADRTELRDQVRAILVAHPDGLTDEPLFTLTGLPEHRRGSVIKRRLETGAVDSERRGVTRSNRSCVVWVLR